MAKQKPFIIRTPFPTEKEVTKELKELGFPINSKRETKQVDKILKDMLDKDKKEKKRKNKK